MVLATINRNGQADVSPKGDPESFLIQEENGSICCADRPGNKKIDSFRNIIDTPVVSTMALLPGCKSILELEGTAELCTDEQLILRFAIQDSQPKLIVKVTSTSVRISPSQAIPKSALWPAAKSPEDLVASEIFRAHIKQSNEKSVQAKVARAAVSLPGAMENALEWERTSVLAIGFIPLPRLVGVTSPRHRWLGPGRAGQYAVIASEMDSGYGNQCR